MHRVDSNGLSSNMSTVPWYGVYSPSPSPDKGPINFGPWSNYSIDNQHYPVPTSNSLSLFLMSIFIPTIYNIFIPSINCTLYRIQII